MANAVDKKVFMEEVQKFPVLYDKFSADFKDKNKKNNAWGEVAKAFNIQASEAAEKYKSIRSAYGRYLKKLKSIPSGSGRPAAAVSQEFEHLKWLDVYIEHRVTTTNVPDVEDDESTAKDCTAAAESFEDEEISTDTSYNLTPSVPSRKKQKVESSVKKNEDLIHESFVKTMENINSAMSGDKSDEVTLFLNSLAPQLVAIREKDPGTYAMAKLQIMQYLFKVQYPDLQIQ